MKKTFAPPLAKSHVLSLREGPEHHAKKEDMREKEVIIYPLSQGTDDSTETKLKADNSDTDVKRWKKSKVRKEEEDVQKRAKRNSSKASTKEMCHLTDLHFEEIVQRALQKSLQECMEESKRTFHQAEVSEVAEQQGLKKETLETSLPAENLVLGSDDPKGRVFAVDLKESMAKPKKCNKLPLNKKRKEMYESTEANKERRKCHRKGEPKKIVQGYTLITDQEETEEGGGSAFNQCVAWVQCSYPSCEKWRRLSSDVDPSVLPEDWTCSQNTDLQYKSCDAPEEMWSGSENDVVYATYVPGSIIWAKQFGYPWWPGMVECDPDIGEYFLFSSRLDSLPSKYHVTFFGNSVSRAWISATKLRNFHELSTYSLGLKKLRNKDYCQKLDSAVKMAKEAEQISIQERVMRFGFISRYSEGRLHEDFEGLFNMAVKPKEQKQSHDGSETMDAMVLPASHFKKKTFLKENTGPVFGSERLQKKSKGQEPVSKECTDKKEARIVKERQESGRSDTKCLKKKFTVPGNKSLGSNQPKPPVGGSKVNLIPSCQDDLNPEVLEMLQVKDSSTMNHPKAYSSGVVFEELQKAEELEKAKEAPDIQETEKNESSEDCSLILFEE
nr:zinc finger CW-type PWWP domain protein 1 isoform X2 [Pelodiscus sinensis]|eukprot:XP_025036232.1 zinc finger CW-type PWWP domain protein 1 isoform X2 [Pelodiscus sinensis]